MNLVVFKTNALGDNVVFLPVVQELRRQFPNARLSLIANPQLAELYAAEVAAEDTLEILPDELRTAWRHPWRVPGWLRWLRARQPDAVFVAYDQSTVAHQLARFSGARIRLGARFGLSSRRTGLTHAVEWDGVSSLAQWQWEMARAFVAELGGAPLAPTPPPPNLAHLLDGSPRVANRVVIHPGSKRALTRWPAVRFAELAARFVRDGLEVVWVDVPEAPAEIPPGVRTVTPGKLRELVQLLANASLFVGNNSGPMHVANALGTPLVVAPGPAANAWNPAWHHERVRLLVRPELACQPCDIPARQQTTCALAGEPLACLKRWNASAVHAVCREMLARFTA